MKKITIHTATYNRGYILSSAYESLKNQTNKDFEWIITDDGSTDNTEELVLKWQKEDNGFDIIYNKLMHVGIPRALNYGVKCANTSWFLMLDSDDYLKNNTIEKVVEWLMEIEDIPEFAGIGFARCTPNGNYMKTQVPIINDDIGFVDASNIERAAYNLDMDMCEVQRVELLKRYPFQCWDTEFFAPEQLCLNAIALAGYKYRWRKEKLYVCDYLPDGMTKDDRIVKKNPMGFAMMHNQNLLIHKTFFKKYKSACYMVALAKYAGNLNFILKSNKPIITALAFPIGMIIAVRRKIQFSKLD